MSKRSLLITAAMLYSAASFGQEAPSMVGRFTIPASVPPTIIPLTLEGDQPLLEVEADGPAGKQKLLALLNMGHALTGWKQHVYSDLGFVRHTAVDFNLGGIPIEAAPGSSLMLDDDAYPKRQIANTFFFTHKVEGIVECGVLEAFDIALDYQQKTLTLASPGTLPHEGVPVPLHIKEETGVVTVDVMVDGKAYPMAIDTGGSFVWVRPSTAATWLQAHPDWARGKGAVGVSDFKMQDDPGEQDGTLIRIPEAQIGPMKIVNLGVLGTASNRTGLLRTDQTEKMYDSWQQDTPPVVGWIGGNVLKHYRVTIDYKARMSWWQKVSDIDPHELDQVGITLVYDEGNYSIGRVATTSDGKPAVTGVEKGDKITAIDNAKVEGWSRDQIFAALHGKPGDIHRVTVERGGKSLTVPLPVMAF